MLRWFRRKAKKDNGAPKDTVLICEDDYGVQEAYKLILNDHYQLKIVANGRQAVKALKQQPIKTMILDLKMPEMDGIEVLKRVKEVSPSTHVIISTGYRSVEVAQEAAQLGCHDYLIKPFHPNDVLSAVKKGFAARN